MTMPSNPRLLPSGGVRTESAGELPDDDFGAQVEESSQSRAPFWPSLHRNSSPDRGDSDTEDANTKHQTSKTANVRSQS